MKTTGYFDTHPGSRPRIFAHRGLVFANGVEVADENTLEAFERALESGADYLESDIQVSSDGVPVLFHDNDLQRLLGKKRTIAEMTFDQISKLRLPFGGRIPSLSEVLEAFPSAKFNLDIKTPAAEEIGIQVILEQNASERVLVSSFSERSRLRALSNSPVRLATSAGSSKVLSCYLAARAKVTKFLASQLVDIDALQIPTKMYGIDFTHPTFLENILATGVEIHYWTINDPAQMELLHNLGAHGIVTDRADIAVKLFS